VLGIGGGNGIADALAMDMRAALDSL